MKKINVKNLESFSNVYPMVSIEIFEEKKKMKVSSFLEVENTYNEKIMVSENTIDYDFKDLEKVKQNVFKEIKEISQSIKREKRNIYISNLKII